MCLMLLLGVRGEHVPLTNFIKLYEALFEIKKFYLRSMPAFAFSELL